MTDVTTIADRATWLSFRADWRLRYAEASEDIRATKRTMQQLVAKRRSGELSADVVDGRMSSLQSELSSQRIEANRLMRRLDKAKERRDALLAERDAAPAAEAA